MLLLMWVLLSRRQDRGWPKARRGGWLAFSLLAAGLAIGVVSACGGETEAGQDAGPDPDSQGGELALRGACEADERLGGFVVEEYETYSIVEGKAANGIVPVTVPEEVHEESGCRLLKRRQLFCNPSCGATETCDEGNSCIPSPLNQDLGTVTVGGLNAAVVMELIPPTNIYFDSQLPHPAYDPLAVISLRSTDGYYGVLELNGIGVHRLEIPDEIWVVEPGEPLSLAWTSPPAEVRSRILFSLNIDQHGNTPLTMYCDFADTGTATVPASVIDALLSYPTSGWPAAHLRRRTADRVEVTGGCVDFIVSSPKTGDVRVAGHTPCDATTPCPPGLTCNIPIGTCE